MLTVKCQDAMGVRNGSTGKITAGLDGRLEGHGGVGYRVWPVYDVKYYKGST